MSDPARMKNELARQLRLMRSACMAFDAGEQEQALNIGTRLRTLFHQTPNSTSLMTHLGADAPKKVHATKRHHGDWKDFLAIELAPLTAPPVRTSPLLGRAILERVPIEDWWAGQPVFVHNGTTFPRRQIVLSMVNKDGGAHVDKLQKFYVALQEGMNFIGITGNFTFDGPAPSPQGQVFYPTTGTIRCCASSVTKYSSRRPATAGADTTPPDTDSAPRRMTHPRSPWLPRSSPPHDERIGGSDRQGQHRSEEQRATEYSGFGIPPCHQSTRMQANMAAIAVGEDCRSGRSIHLLILGAAAVSAIALVRAAGRLAARTRRAQAANSITLEGK